MEFCHSELGPSGYSKEVAALHGDHYTLVHQSMPWLCLA